MFFFSDDYLNAMMIGKMSKEIETQTVFEGFSTFWALQTRPPKGSQTGESFTVPVHLPLHPLYVLQSKLIASSIGLKPLSVNRPKIKNWGGPGGLGGSGGASGRDV